MRLTPPEACPFCTPFNLEVLDLRTDQTPCMIVKPLNPVVEGHVLAMPVNHHSLLDPAVFGAMMKYAATYAASTYDEFNILTSFGSAATQTVQHLHVHIVPRRKSDQLCLPWSHG